MIQMNSSVCEIPFEVQQGQSLGLRRCAALLREVLAFHRILVDFGCKGD